jgi:hypothetical protein
VVILTEGVVEAVPFDQASQLNQFMIHIQDRFQRGPEQIAVGCSVFVWTHGKSSLANRLALQEHSAAQTGNP